MENLSKDEDISIRRLIIVNPQITKEIIINMQDDKDTEIRSIIASHALTPIDILIKYGNDDDSIKCQLAINPNTPIHIIEKLVNDETFNDKNFLAKRNDLTYDICNKLSKHDN